MKFQNCILINFEWTDGHTDMLKAIFHFNFIKVGGIIKLSVQFQYLTST